MTRCDSVQYIFVLPPYSMLKLTSVILSPSTSEVVDLKVSFEVESKLEDMLRGVPVSTGYVVRYTKYPAKNDKRH